MLIPIRCFTCGKPIAHLWESYLEKIQLKYSTNVEDGKINRYYDIKTMKDIKSPEGSALDDLKIDRYCCRRMFLTNVDMCEKI
tara:strand:- start:103 stop:351 length:249 start_codon:yes stop_codon:yes gene_type:complete